MRLINPKIKVVFNKKRFLLLILLIVGITFIYANNSKNVSAEEESIVCPLSKMVTVGSLMDQSLVSVNNLLLEAHKVLLNSALAYQAASEVVKTSKEDCKPVNCQSSCRIVEEYYRCGGYECASGYNCYFQGIFKGDQIGDGVYDCGTINHFNPDHNKHYSKFSLNEISPCIGPTCLNSTCYREACRRDPCQENDCSGQACPFDLIRGLVGNISTGRAAVEEAHKKIKDFFYKRITKFPEPDGYVVFGKFCEHYVLSKLCTNCPGTLSAEIDACQSEFYALMALQNKATSNIKKCDIISSDDLFEEKQGEILFRCEDVRPSPLKQCWQDDFFCCTAEEPK